MISSNYSDIILQIIKIQDEVFDASTTIDEATKQDIRLRSAMLISTVANQPKLNAYGFKCLVNELLMVWNNNISPDTEKFWDVLNSNNLPVERKDLIKDVLTRGRFKTVEQGIDARNHWAVLRGMSLITERFLPEQISRIAQIITADEQKRLAILQKVLIKGKISNSQYLKFSASFNLPSGPVAPGAFRLSQKKLWFQAPPALLRALADSFDALAKNSFSVVYGIFSVTMASFTFLM